MKKKQFLIIGLFLISAGFLFLGFASRANASSTYFVRTDGSDTICTGAVDASSPGSGTSQPCAWATIQHAIDNASSGVSTINVGAGTYNFGAATYYIFGAQNNGKTITLNGVSSASTIITGSAQYIFWNDDATSLNLTFNNFTITSTYNTAGNGYIIRDNATGSNSLSFNNCIIGSSAATVSDLIGIIYSGSESNPTRQLTIKNSTIYGHNGGSAILISGAGGISIDTVTGITDAGHFVMLSNNIGDITIKNSQYNYNSNKSAGMFLRIETNEVTSCNSATITGNNMTVAGDGIRIEVYCKSVNIQNNAITMATSGAGDGIALGVDVDNPYNLGTVSVIGNNVQFASGASGKHAVFIGSGVIGGEISQNVVIAPDQFSLVVKGQSNNIHNNLLVGSNPIWLSTNGSSNIIKYNTLYATENYGLSWLKVGSEAASNNQIYDNIIVGATGAQSVIEDQSSGHFGNILNHNLYYNAGATHFARLNGAYIDSFSAYQNGWQNYSGAPAGNEVNSSYADPQFINPASNYQLSATSPAIDAGFTLLSTTTDTLGNPIYGVRDIGAYEYQPTLDLTKVTADTIDVGAGARIYADGKFRNLTVTSGAQAHLKITPEGGSFAVYDATTTRPAWLDVTTITNWTASRKTWTESNAQSSNMVTSHTIGDLDASKYYIMSVTGASASSISGVGATTCSTINGNAVCQSDGLGSLSFEYTGGYSTHTFDMTEDSAAPTGSISSANGSLTNNVTPTLNLTIADSGVGVTGAQMRFSCNNSDWSSWEDYATPKTNFNIKTGAGCTNADGSKIVYVQFKDSLGNASSSYNTGSFTLDTTSSFATLSGSPASQTGSNSANITVAGTDVGYYKYKLDAGSYGADTLVATHITLSSLADGQHTLYVLGKDSAGNWQAEGSATTYSWTIDTVPPVISGFTLSSTSASFSVALTFAAADTGGTGVAGYFVNETGVTPLASDAGWVATAPTSYAFSSQGSKNLYGWAKDEIGNISSRSSASTTIILPTGGGALMYLGVLNSKNITPPAIQTPSMTTPVFVFTRTLQLGDTNPDVQRLQQFLNTHGFIVSATGVGSSGHETQKFGFATRNALIKFQEANANQILKPAGLTKGTGKFARATINFVNGMIAGK